MDGYTFKEIDQLYDALGEPSGVDDGNQSGLTPEQADYLASLPRVVEE